MRGECRRWRLFAAGIVCTALGIALVTQAGRGTSAVASPAYVLSQIFPWSMGAFTVCINLGMMALQALLMGRAFFPRQLLQLPASLVLVCCWICFATYCHRCASPGFVWRWDAVCWGSASGSSVWGVFFCCPRKGPYLRFPGDFGWTSAGSKSALT